jgi:hypothetical protein
MTSGIPGGSQKVHLVRVALEGRHAGILEGKQEVRWLQIALLLQSGDSLEDLHHVRRRARE